MENKLDVISFAIILSHFAEGNTPTEVCKQFGVHYGHVLDYADAHDLTSDLYAALATGASENSEEEECVLENRGECVTCAE